MSGYSDDEIRIITAQVRRISDWAGPEPRRWVQLLEFLVGKELAGDLNSEPLTAPEIAEEFEGDRRLSNLVAAHAHHIRTHLRTYYSKHAGSRDLLGISLPRGAFRIRFRRRPLLERLTPLWLNRQIQNIHKPVEISPSVFLTAAASPALWILTCRMLEWKYFLGGSGNEPSGLSAFVWGMVSSLPVALYLAVRVSGTYSVSISVAERLRILRLIAAQCSAAGFGAFLFYSLSLRAFVESWRLPTAVQELLIAGIWSSLFTWPLLASAGFILGWPFAESFAPLARQVIVPLTILIGLFQWIMPSSQPIDGCEPSLVIDRTRGILIRVVAGACESIPARIVFDQARGLLAGVGLPFLTIFALLRLFRSGSTTEADTRPDQSTAASAG
jgi:hypothetical protein